MPCTHLDIIRKAVLQVRKALDVHSNLKPQRCLQVKCCHHKRKNTLHDQPSCTEVGAHSITAGLEAQMKAFAQIEVHRLPKAVRVVTSPNCTWREGTRRTGGIMSMRGNEGEILQIAHK
jgi:hypothetical protein